VVNLGPNAKLGFLILVLAFAAAALTLYGLATLVD